MGETKLIAFDLDDTLAPSKSPLPDRMKDALVELLQYVEVCVISGGQFGQFKTQLIDRLDPVVAPLERLHLMPTCGTQYYRFNGEWQQQYEEALTPEQIAETMTALETRAKELGLWETETWGPILEDRRSQVTFSALGQEAPVDAKKAWDPDGSKKSALRDAVARDVPELEVRSGGSTSVDVTRRGIDKAYGMQKLAEESGYSLDAMLFIGDRLDPDGNDYPVAQLGVKCLAVRDWEETAGVIERLNAVYRGEKPAEA